MNKQTFNKAEDKCFQKFKDFNQFLNLKDIKRTAKYSPTDVEGYTNFNQLVKVELKDRNLKLSPDLKIIMDETKGTYTATTIFIEAHKYLDLLLARDYDNAIPLYINFLKDDYVLVYNLSSRLKRKPLETRERKVHSMGYEGFELTKRKLLQLEDAYIYQKQGNTYTCLQKGN